MGGKVIPGGNPLESPRRRRRRPHPTKKAPSPLTREEGALQRQHAVEACSDSPGPPGSHTVTLVAPTSQYAKHTKQLRFNQPPQAVFRLLATTFLSEGHNGRSGVQIRLAGMARSEKSA